MLTLDEVEKVRNYVNKKIDLRDLENWVIPQLAKFPTLLKDSSDLISIIELGLAELSSKVITEDELRVRLDAYLTSFPVINIGTANPGAIFLSSQPSTIRQEAFAW